MCKKCNEYKWMHQEYNFCPICGNKLKSIVFISSTNIESKPDFRRNVYFDAAKCR